jgi:hypothetical protein
MFVNWLGRCSRAAGVLSAVLVTWLAIGAGSAYAQQQGAIAGTIKVSRQARSRWKFA